jgi:hypothetical protein
MDLNRYKQIKFVGIDETNGRFAEVNIRQCKACGRLWLHYLVEFEAIPASGRYFMGLITRESADSLPAGGAIEYLNQLDWHLYGGSYFNGQKGRSTNQVNADR